MILFIDDFNGISGDILLASFIDAGFPLEILKDNLKKINIENEFEIFPEKVNSFGLSGTKIKITEKPLKSRKFIDIKNLIIRSNLDRSIKDLSLKILLNLAEVEASIHSIDINEVHFHEIGAIDTLIDAIGVASAINFFNIEECYISEIQLGKGKIHISHGTYPNPAPATLELLKGYRIKFLNLEKEITTPTGAAIIKSLNCKQDDNLSIIPEIIGYGFGHYKFDDRPNFSRIIIGICEENLEFNSKIIEINFNVDDMTGEEIGYFISEIMKQNILDISVISTITKKNRPGYLITILVNDINEKLLKNY